jgi:hypothetical protein
MRPGRSRIVVHKPVLTAGLQEFQLEELKLKVKKIIEEPFTY